jgi:hypothetical protein
MNGKIGIKRDKETDRRRDIEMNGKIGIKRDKQTDRQRDRQGMERKRVIKSDKQIDGQRLSDEWKEK